VAYNPYIIIPFASWAVAQIAKFAIAAFKGKIDFRYLYASGGMPSVHSAVVCSLAVTALLVDGVGSHLFGFTLIFAAVVIAIELSLNSLACISVRSWGTSLERLRRVLFWASY
jgi:uncharacterized protein